MTGCRTPSWALGRIGPVSKEVAPALIASLKDEHASVRDATKTALNEDSRTEIATNKKAMRLPWRGGCPKSIREASWTAIAIHR